MSNSYRYKDGNRYITRFEIEGEPNPKIWAFNMQCEGWDIEEGTMIWDDRDRCGWEWTKTLIKQRKRKDGRKKITYELTKQFLDLKAKLDSIRDVAEALDITYEEAHKINIKLNSNSYKNYVEMWILGVTEYAHNYIEGINEDTFGRIWDMWDNDMNQTEIGIMMNINRRTVCDVVNLTAKKYRDFKEKR